MNGIWKPGTAPPTTPHNDTDKKMNQMKKSKKNLSSGKKLSGSTMNMRFMQRKKESTPASSKKKVGADTSTNASDASRNEMKNWREQSDSMEEDNKNRNEGTSLRDDNSMEEGEPNVDVSTGVEHHRPQTATDADIYGIGAQIIGRRSFGGFNKVVQETWSSALKEIEQSQKESRSDNKNRDRKRRRES